MKNVCDEEHEYEYKKICRLTKNILIEREATVEGQTKVLRWRDKGTIEPAMFTADMDSRDAARWIVPRRMQSDLSGLSATTSLSKNSGTQKENLSSLFQTCKTAFNRPIICIIQK